MANFYKIGVKSLKNTANTEAGKLAGTLNLNFEDNSNDGVNNPGKIIYTYSIS